MHPVTDDDGDLLRSLHQYRTLAERSPDVLSRHDAETTFCYVSPAVRDVLGWEPAELLGRTVGDLGHPDDAALLERERRALLDGDDESRHVYRLRHRLGHYLWVETTNTIVVEAPGSRELEVVSARRDVTERVAMERLLRESEQRFRLAFENAPIGIALVGLDGRFLRANDAFCRILARSRDDVLRLAFQDVTHPDDLPANLEWFRRAVSDGTQPRDLEKRYVRPSGEIVWAQVNASLVRDGDTPLYCIAQIQDISARRRAQEELRREREALARSNAELERFAAVAAHDLQASLRTVAGFAELLTERLEGHVDPDASRDLGRIIQGTRRMQSLLDGIRAYSRVQFTDAERRRRVELDEVLEGVRQALMGDIASAEATLEVGALPVVHGDPVQLHQLFENLLSNALKYRGERRLTIRVSARREGDRWVIAVTDTGIGISGDDAQRMFEMGRRLHPSSKYPGTGIGLAICRAVAERHGGAIRAMPATTGGTTVEVSLPVAPARADG